MKGGITSRDRSRGSFGCRMFNAHISRRWIHGLPRKTSRRQRAAWGWRVGMMPRHWKRRGGARERHSNAGYTTLLFTLEPEEILHFQTTLFLLPCFSIFSAAPTAPPAPVSLPTRNSPTCSSPLPSFTSHLSGSSARGRQNRGVRAALHYHL